MQFNYNIYIPQIIILETQFQLQNIYYKILMSNKIVTAICRIK